jgi:hypothetical protein
MTFLQRLTFGSYYSDEANRPELPLSDEFFGLNGSIALVARLLSRP